MALDHDRHEDGEAAHVERRAEFARVLARNGYPRVHVLTLDEAADVLTERRREIIDALRTDEYGSVRELARQLDRDKGAVSRDLSILAERGVTTLDREGSAKQPRLRAGTLVVEPVAITDEEQ